METGGKQYKVTQGSILDVEKLELETPDVVFDKVLLLSDESVVTIGKPYLADVTVKATVLEEIKDKKVIVFKYKNKTGYKKTQGHRQKYTRIKVQEIVKG